MDVLEKFAGLIGDPAVEIDIGIFAFAIAVSSVVGIIVAAFYQIFYENRATGSQIHRSFMLMSPAITSLFIAIQFSLPLSLGLLGALSIVRFRTPIKEPEEIGFLMLLIACSVVCATLQFELLVILLAFAVTLLLAQKYVPRLSASKRKDGMVLVSMESANRPGVSASMIKELERLLPNGQLERISTTEGLTTISYSFLGFRAAAFGEVEASLKQVASLQQLNIFFNKQGAMI